MNSMFLRTIILYAFLTTIVVCGAKEVTIHPQFAVGDTIRYRTSAQILMYHENDSLSSTTKLLPELIVEEKNDKGFIIKTTTKLDSFKYHCSDPNADNELMILDQTKELNDFAAAIVLRIQLDADGRPDSILNMDAVKQSILNIFIKVFAKETDDIKNDPEWEKNTKPLLISAVSAICNPKNLIEEQFGYLPYFTFIGIPLKSGTISSEIILPDKFSYSEVSKVKITVRQIVNTTQLNISNEDGVYVIDINGAKGNSVIEGQLLYVRGILNNGYLTIKVTESETERHLINLIINQIIMK